MYDFFKSPDWNIEGRDWPIRQHSRFTNAGGVRWHVQRFGAGPQLLLIHGTAASTHSWARLAPMLSSRFEIISFDLPGHGFSSHLKTAATIENMTSAVNALMKALDVDPVVIVGHSAGAAIGVKLALARKPVKLLVGVSPALAPFSGAAGFAFPLMAKLISLNPVAAPAFAFAASDRARVERLIAQTGSAIDAEGVEYYARLLRCPGHIRGALSMMAAWNLTSMPANLKGLHCKSLFIIGENDAATPPESIKKAVAYAPHAECWIAEGLGDNNGNGRKTVRSALISGMRSMRDRRSR